MATRANYWEIQYSRSAGFSPGGTVTVVPKAIMRHRACDNLILLILYLLFLSRCSLFKTRPPCCLVTCPLPPHVYSCTVMCMLSLFFLFFRNAHAHVAPSVTSLSSCVHPSPHSDFFLFTPQSLCLVFALSSVVFAVLIGGYFCFTCLSHLHP